MSEYNVGDYYHRPGDRLDLSRSPLAPRRRRDPYGYARMFEAGNAVRQPDGTIALVPVRWWVRRWRAVRRWVRP